MKDSTSSQDSSRPSLPPDGGFSPWQRLKSKRISYLTLPLLVMATVTEFVILATGWKYQQVVCLPQGMGVTFFGIGPIGATILAVELLKLPLAIWTASRHGWQKALMLVVGLPLICVLTFQLVKDMAVYEMGVAMTPASQYLEKATAEETKITQLNGELAAIEEKKTDHEHKLAELAAQQAKAKADLDELLKRNDDQRHDAISLTDYQKKELFEVDNRESAIIAQFNSDTAQLAKAIADLRAQREPEEERATRWNAEEARIENAYKAKMADYTNRKAAYDKEKREYDNASFLKRQLLKEPVDPGVPPVRESNIILKPTELAEIDAQISAKEAELAAVNNKRRERVAQMENDARQLREQFDQRSSTKREEADRKRDELSAAETALAMELKAEEKQLDAELAVSVQKVDGIRAELEAARKKAEGYYEAREAAIRNTQVHRIATTVEIVRGLLKGERPASIKASAKERGDILTDQISMVRIWVYPVLAFIVAFLPTLMVELGFSTVFHPEKERPAHRLGFFGRRLHWVEVRAGRQRILRAERAARESLAEMAGREKALAAAKLAADRALAEREVELQAAREAMAAAAAEHEAELKRAEAEHAEQARNKEEAWVAKLAGMAEALNRTVVEKDALRALQKSEVERQVQMRQTAWSDRLAQLRQELDEQRAAGEAERTALVQDHQKKLMQMAEDSKNQVTQLRRQMAETESAAAEKTARLAHDLKEASHGREAAESQLKHQADTFALKLAQAQEHAARELEKAARQEKHHLDWQELEFEKKMRQREDALEQQLKQREQELSLAFDARLTEEKCKLEEEARTRDLERERQLHGRDQEAEAYWNQEVQKREEAAQAKLKQREQQLQAQADTRLREMQAQAEEKLRERQSEFERELEVQSRSMETRFREELQQKEAYFQTKLKQREQELTARADTRAAELQKQWAAELRVREEDWARRTETRVSTIETRLNDEAQQKEELFQSKLRQRDQQWQGKLEALRAELQVQSEEALRRRGAEADAALRELEGQLLMEMQQKDAAAQARAKQREQEVIAQVKSLWEAETESKMFAAMESFKALLARTEKERDEARQSALDGARQVENLEKKLTEVSSFLNGWRTGKNLAETA
jgi:hypothetical protein